MSDMMRSQLSSYLKASSFLPKKIITNREMWKRPLQSNQLWNVGTRPTNHALYLIQTTTNEYYYVKSLIHTLVHKSANILRIQDFFSPYLTPPQAYGPSLHYIFPSSYRIVLCGELTPPTVRPKTVLVPAPFIYGSVSIILRRGNGFANGRWCGLLVMFKDNDADSWRFWAVRQSGYRWTNFILNAIFLYIHHYG